VVGVAEQTAVQHDILLIIATALFILFIIGFDVEQDGQFTENLLPVS